MTYRLRPEAEADIERTVLRIAADNPTAARAWVEDIHDRCRRLGLMPGIGVDRSDIRRGLRLFPVRNYLIIYRATKHGIEIVRVLHGAQQWESFL